MGAGRPSAYRPEFAEQAEKLCRLGATDSEMAGFFGVSEQTINAWKDAHPEFLESLKTGKAQADAEVADKLFRRATGYEHEAVKIFNDGGTALVVPYTERYPPDPTSMIFWLKNRRPDLWRDVRQQELTGAGGGPIEVAALSPEERQAAAKRLLDQAFGEKPA
jgi:DNA-binding XRE family transcriptional regulator